MYIDEISFCTIYIIMDSILVKQVMIIKNLELITQWGTRSTSPLRGADKQPR